ncbi:MAG: SMP-30/gluconolactonase/LRE family protein [Gammaproteobacteria bacterium]|nr:SMP-30/gluconolactonase/LRE family protein [Gammaproteobacteria bacterium]MDH5629562.1 SMP-30/gluconolactonase/LRE family protein [Gammaproteobacteria bacterium]
MVRKLLYLLGTIVAFLLVFVFYPAQIDPQSWEAPRAPEMEGSYQKNELLDNSELIALGEIYGPEDVALDAQGRIYGGTQDGYIKRVNLDGSVESWMKTGGRPLGLHFDSNENLIVCDAYQGLISISPEGEMEILSREADGESFKFTNDLDIAADGKIYFTDASTRWNQSQYKLDLLEMQPTGRFMVYDPETQTTTVLMDELYFANGVALSQNEDFVVINETWKYRIHRYWLKGEKAGSSEIFIDNLPGFPDGISSNRNGTFWLALPTPRLADVDKMHPKPWLKSIVSKLPDAFKPKPIAYGLVLGLNEQGEVIYNLQDTDGQVVKEITSVQEHDGYIYLGSLHNNRIGRYPLAELE